MLIKDFSERPPRAGFIHVCNDDGNLRFMDATGRKYRLRPESGTPVHGVVATGIINPTGSNNSILYTAVTVGSVGNGITVQYAMSGSGSAVLSIGVADKSILITAGSATTAADVITAVNSDEFASALVTASASGTVTGAIAAVSATNLTGGVTATTASKGDQMIDADYLYTATAHVEETSTSGWKKSAVASI